MAISEKLSIRRLKENIPADLLRLTSSRDILNVIQNACACSFDHDEPVSENEAGLLAEFLQEAQDFGDLHRDLEAGDHVKAAFRMSALLQKIEDAGFMVFGGREVQRLEGGIGASAAWPVAIIRVRRSTSPENHQSLQMSKSKKQIIADLIEQAREFHVGPSDDGDKETAVTSGYRHLVIQFKRLAGPILPEAAASRLNAIDVEVNDIYSALDAKAELEALLPDIESALARLDDERHGAIYRVPAADLRKEIELQRSLMIAVATGGPRIQTVDDEYQTRRATIRDGIAEREIEEPNPYDDLWAWYGKWSGGDLPTYQARRQFISELYAPVLNQIRAEETGQRGVREREAPTGWIKAGPESTRRGGDFRQPSRKSSFRPSVLSVEKF